MKRLLTFLALCCLMVTGAWAQFVLTGEETLLTLDELKATATNGGHFAVAPISTDEATKLKYYNGGGSISQNLTADYLWTLVPSGEEGQYYIQTGDAKYFQKENFGKTTNVDNAQAFSIVNATTTANKNYESQAANYARFKRVDAETWINCQSNGVGTYNNGTGSWTLFATFGPYYVVTVEYTLDNVKVDERKVVVRGGENTIDEAPNMYVVKTPAHLDNVTADCNATVEVEYNPSATPVVGKTYRITLSGDNQYVYYLADDANGNFKMSNTVTADDTNGHFIIGGSEADGYTLYSVGADAYVQQDSGNNAKATITSEETAAARYDWVVNNGHSFFKIHGSTDAYVNNRDNGYFSTWTHGDIFGTEGSMMTFTEVEDVPVTPAVVVPSTLNPEDKATVESLEKVSVKFSVAEGAYYPYMASDYAKPEVLPYFSKGGTNVMASLAKNSEDEGLFEITPSETLSDGEWTLTIPEGAFWIWNGDLDAEAQPVAEITATYTVGNVVAFDADKYYTISCLKNGAYANCNPNAVENDETYLARTGSATSFSSYFRIVANGDYWNIIPAATPDKYVYAISTENKDANVGIGSMDATADAALWQIVKNGDGFNIIPKGGSNGWNCRGSKNGVDVIGQWDHNDTNDNRWVFTEVDTHITDLANLRNDKAYVLICQRGQLSTSEGQFVPVAKDREDAYTAKANKFAIIKSGDKYYLWSVAEDGYVRTDKAIHTLLAAQPITLTAQSDGTFLLVLNGSGVNMQENLSKGIIINNYTTPDAGNKYAIYEVGDFADAATAIAAIPGTWKIEDGHIYTIKAHFNGEGQNALYLTKDSNTTLQFAETATATPVQSYWIARATGDDARPWKFQAAYGDGTYLDANNAENALSTTGLNMEVAPIDKNYCYMKASLTGVGNRYIGTYCTADEKYPGFGLYGSTCYGNSLNHSGWTTYYEIAEVTDGSCAYDVISTNENGGVVVSNITDFNGATEVLDGGVVVTAQTITTDNLAPKSIDGLTGNVILDTEAHTITVEYGQNYTVSISGTHAAEAKVLYNGVEYGNTEPFFVAGTPTVEEIAATYYENEYAKITIDEENTTVNVEYRSTANAGVYSIGASTQNILPGKWYIMTQTRGGETPVYNNGEDSSIKRAGQNASTVLAPATKFTGVADKYLIRFTEGDYEGTYQITFADGGLWNGYQVKATAGNYLIKPAVNTSQNKPGLAINVTNNGTTYGSRLDNNGKGTEVSFWGSGAYASGENNVWYIYPVELDEVYTVTFNLGAPVNQTITGTAFNGQTPVMPFTVPDYVTATYSPELVPATGETTYDVSFDYNDLMPFTPGELTTVDIDIRNHYYFHVEERTITIDGESKKLWLPCISPKAPTFDDDAAYIWRMEGDWYHGFRFHNDQLAKEGEGDGTACHITYKHKEVMSDTEEQMEGMKGETSLTEKTYTLESTTDLSIASRATLTGDADDRNSYFELVHATGNIQHYNGDPAEWQFRLMDHKNLYLNFRDYSAVGDNPDSLLCLYGGGYGDNASSFTFHKNEVCTEDDRQAVLAMIDAIEKGAVGAIIDKTAQEYQDLLTLKGRIENTTIGCTRALFDIYTEKLVNANKERKVATDGEAYRLAVRTKQGRNFYLKDDGTYTTDSLAASIYVLGSSADGTKKILAGNNNEDLYYFRNSGLTKAAYETDACDLSCELMANKETVDDVLDATGAAKYATVCLTDGNGKVATMTSPDKAVTGGDCEWEAQDVVYMNDDLSSAIVMEPVPYPYNKPKFAVGSPDDHEGGYASIWLPYPMIFPDGVEVYRATDAESDGLLVLKKVNTDRVVAAGGYIIRDPNKASTMTVLPAPANPDDVEYSETNAFVGSTENPLVVKEEGSWSAFLTAQGNPTGTPYVLAKKNEGIGYYKYNAGTDDLLPKGKAIWFSNYKADSSSDCLRFSFEEVISAIEALHGNTNNAEIYDLQGHRLNKVEKGQVNVINGKKVMFK